MAWVQSSSLVGGRWMLESGFCWWENLLLTYDCVITLTIGYNRAVNPRRFRYMDSRCESKFPTSNGLLLLELTTIAVRM